MYYHRYGRIPEIGFGKAAFKTDNPIEEMGIKQDVIAAPISQW